MKVIKVLAQLICFGFLGLEFYTILCGNLLTPRLFVGSTVIVTALACFLYAIEAKEEA